MPTDEDYWFTPQTDLEYLRDKTVQYKLSEGAFHSSGIGRFRITGPRPTGEVQLQIVVPKSTDIGS